MLRISVIRMRIKRAKVSSNEMRNYELINASALASPRHPLEIGYLRAPCVHD